MSEPENEFEDLEIDGTEADDVKGGQGLMGGPTAADIAKKNAMLAMQQKAQAATTPKPAASPNEAMLKKFRTGLPPR